MRKLWENVFVNVFLFVDGAYGPTIALGNTSFGACRLDFGKNGPMGRCRKYRGLKYV